MRLARWISRTYCLRAASCSVACLPGCCSAIPPFPFAPMAFGAAADRRIRTPTSTGRVSAAQPFHQPVEDRQTADVVSVLGAGVDGSIRRIETVSYSPKFYGHTGEKPVQEIAPLQDGSIRLEGGSPVRSAPAARSIAVSESFSEATGTLKPASLDGLPDLSPLSQPARDRRLAKNAEPGNRRPFAAPCSGGPPRPKTQRPGSVRVML